MDFALPRHHQLIQRTVRRFVNEELIPYEREKWAESEPLPAAEDKRLRDKVKALGLYACAVPKIYGGAGLGILGWVIVREEISKCAVGDIRNERGFGGNPWPILYECNDEQKKRYLLPIVRGEKLSFFGMTEPNAGNDASSILTTAVRDGDDWVINGTKMFIGGVQRTDFGIIFAMTDKQKGIRGGLTAFVVERDTPGFQVVREIPTMGAAVPSELSLVNCRVPSSQVIGEVGQAFISAQKNLSITRIMHAPMCLGASQRGLDMTIEYAKQRVTFGQPIAKRQAVQWMLADSYAEIQACRLMAYQAAWKIDQGEDPRYEAPLIKTFGDELASRVLDKCIQIHGAAGVSRDLPLERLYRDARSLRITEAGSEVQRWVIARNLLHD
ncbi:MAG: acyl-CoA dehydrogenase family protein [Chloroflexi bacterium]|nr:acyl-CoA dehydrogenase family protein [Chloroflexota bacterium]